MTNQDIINAATTGMGAALGTIILLTLLRGPAIKMSRITAYTTGSILGAGIAVYLFKTHDLILGMTAASAAGTTTLLLLVVVRVVIYAIDKIPVPQKK